VNGFVKRISSGGGSYFAGKKYCIRCEVYMNDEIYGLMHKYCWLHQLVFSATPNEPNLFSSSIDSSVEIKICNLNS
jgi:hypothetical protein